MPESKFPNKELDGLCLSDPSSKFVAPEDGDCIYNHQPASAIHGVSIRRVRGMSQGRRGGAAQEAMWARWRMMRIYFLGGGGMNVRNMTAWAAGLLLLGGCAEQVTSPSSSRKDLVDGTNVPVASVGTTINLTIRPSSPEVTASNVNGVAGDSPTGFATGSFASNGVAKSEIYFTPAELFGRDVVLSEISSISYWTKTGATHAADPRDWYLVLYTKKYAGQAVSTNWYGARIGSEPYFSANIADPANTWNAWSTGGASNTLRFFESTSGATGANFGSYTDPNWSTFLTGGSFAGPDGPGSAYAGQQLLLLSIQTGSAWAAGFTGQLDGLRVELTDGSVATVNFEENLAPCTATCYVDGTNGNDAYSGATIADAKKTIQAAINQVSAGGTVRVLPGTYNETAAGSLTTSLGYPSGGYQFGLFFPSAKPGITLMGVTAADAPIASAAGVQATVNTNATNSFGYSGIFVEAANTTIRGLALGPNAAGDNKTIEVVADNFTLQYASSAVPGGGAIYISEFDPPATAVSSYHILDNYFGDATQVAISSGAGQGGAVSGREIKGNTFNLGGNSWPGISFNGTGGVPWYTKPVGGAVITGNTFGGGSLQYIRSRGTVNEPEFDWSSFWNDNTYDKGTVDLLTEAPFVVRPFSYTSGPYTFTNVRRIGSSIGEELTLAAAGSGDVVLAKAGTYNESGTIAVPLTLKGAGIGSTIMQGPGTGTGLSLAAGLNGVTIRDLGVQGYDVGIAMPSGPLNNVTVQDVASINNKTHGIFVQAFGITNMAFTRVNASGNNAAGGLAGRGLWIINGVKTNVSITDGTYNNNGLVGIDVSDGNVTGLTITGNVVTGNGDSGIGVLGAQGPGANLVANNTVTNNGRYGIEIKIPNGNGATSGPGSIVVSGNVVSRTVPATDPRDYAGIAVFRRSVDPAYNAAQPSGVVVTGNNVSGYHRSPSLSTGDGFGIVVEGTNHLVTKNLVAGNDVGIQIQSGNTANVQGTDYFDRGDAAPSSALINRNSITGNANFDVRNVGAALTDATCNWYGASTGPVAAKISGSLTVSPWLTSSNLNGSCALDNQGPITMTNAPSPAPIGTPIGVTASISDVTTGNNDLLSWSWSLNGANQGTTAFATSAVTQNVAFSVPANAVSDVDEVCVWGTDVYGNVGAPSCVLAVWFDPSAGFVTGGGWINSPANAYIPDPSLTGRANFGFTAKYQKGKTVPSGNTQFQFNAANLNFSSTSIQWLVVAGARAQFKGTGTINGAGNYTFMLTAIDGSLPGGGGADKFRMKIMDASGGLVYDNMLNAPDTSDPTTVLGGGSIHIHK